MLKWVALLLVGMAGYAFMGSASDSGKYDQVTAIVNSVDLRCKLATRSRTSSSEDYADCSDDRDFRRLRANPGAAGMRPVGEAVVGASYTKAGSQVPEQAVFSIDASEKEFYRIAEGDSVRIGISKTDPNDVRFYGIATPAG